MDVISQKDFKLYDLGIGSAPPGAKVSGGMAIPYKAILGVAVHLSPHILPGIMLMHPETLASIEELFANAQVVNNG